MLRIASIGPPPDGAEDFHIWQHSTDGIFMIKSAYNVLLTDQVREASDFTFNAVWKVRTSPQINTFLWRVAHSRLMTNSERLARGISDSDLCPRCHLLSGDQHAYFM